MGRPKTSDARDIRREILEAALELFAENGFHGATLRDIAQAVGIQPGAIYHHFTSKDALFQTLLAEMQREIAATFEYALVHGSGKDIGETLEQLTIRLLERFATLRERRLFRILMSDGLRLASQGRLDVWSGLVAQKEILQIFARRLVPAGRLREVRAELLVLEFIGPIMVWRQLLEIGDDNPFANDPRGFAREHAQHFLRGAAAARAAPRKSNGRSTPTRRRPRTARG